MIAGIAVQMISSLVLPWIGGPSLSSSPGLMRNFRRSRGRSSRRARRPAPRRSAGRPTACRSSWPGRTPRGEPVDQQRERDAEDRRDGADQEHLCGLWDRLSCEGLRLLGAHRLSSPMDAASYGRAATDGPRSARQAARARSAARRAPREPAPRRPGSPTARRRDSAGTPSRTGRAGGSRRDAPPRAPSASRAASISAARSIRTRGEVVAERRAPDLGVGALELPSRGRHATGDVVERELGGVLALDDRVRLLEEAGA